MHTRTPMYTHVHMYMHADTCTHTLLRVHTHVNTLAHMNAHIHTYTLSRYARAYADTCTQRTHAHDLLNSRQHLQG